MFRKNIFNQLPSLALIPSHPHQTFQISHIRFLKWPISATSNSIYSVGGFPRCLLKELMLSLSSGIDIYFLFARGFWPMFLKAHLTIPYASLRRLYRASCRLRDGSAPFWFSVFTMCLCMFTRVASVLCVKLQVWDLTHWRAAVLVSLSHRARGRERALYCKYTWRLLPWSGGQSQNSQEAMLFKFKEDSLLQLSNWHK